jgi:phosphatidylglycerol---prolipoprotein diacylglyceryl transferase
VGGWPIPSYSVFMSLAVVVGLLLFWRETFRQKAISERSFYVLLAALFGGALGAKLLVVVLHWHTVAARFPDLSALISGRSIVGGLIGGAAGVFLAKRWLGITARTGNLFVPGIAAGVAVGRLGCFLRGCCYGKPTALPWGVDFGDGVPRHPTQLYEALFMAVVLCLGLAAVRRLPNPPGLVFALLMIVYFTFRFLIEFVRCEEMSAFGLTFFQWLSAGVVVFYGMDLIRLWREKQRVTS